MSVTNEINTDVAAAGGVAFVVAPVFTTVFFYSGFNPNANRD